jgi:hypothetical protein
LLYTRPKKKLGKTKNLMSAPTKIDINPAYADELRKQNKGIQPFINDLLARYLEGNVILLTAENKAALEIIVEKTGKGLDYIVNFVLSDVEICLPEEKPKLKITIDEHKFKTKKKITVKNSFVNKM